MNTINNLKITSAIISEMKSNNYLKELFDTLKDKDDVLEYVQSYAHENSIKYRNLDAIASRLMKYWNKH